MTCGTDRLRFEALSEAHAAAMLPLLQDDRLYAYMPNFGCSTVEALQARCRRLAGGSPTPEEIWWNFIVYLHESPAPIGYVQATLRPGEHLAELAYVLWPAHWGRGYATEAVGWLMQQLRRRGDIDKAQAQIDARNRASIAVVRRLGFEFSRTVIEECSIDSLFERVLPDFASFEQAPRSA